MQRISTWVVTAFLVAAPWAAADSCHVTGFNAFPGSNPSSPGSPLSVVAFGSSVTWGDGLHTPDTFRYQVAAWLASTTGKPVRLWTFAHSAGFLKVIPGVGTLSPDPTAGAINGNWPEGVYPAVTDQADCAFRNGLGDANLVLLDGCINEVNAENIVDPRISLDEIQKRTKIYCRDSMKDTLVKVKTSFPKAAIVVVAYFPVISAKSTITGFRGTHRLAGFAKKTNQGRVTTPVSIGSPQDELKIMVEKSEAFYQDSKTSIQAAIDEVNSSTSPPRIYFAKLPEIQVNGIYTIDPDFAYGAPRTQEWLMPLKILWIRINPDPEFDTRRAACERAYRAGLDRLVCDANAAFHPNVARATSYAQSIEKAVPSAELDSWRSR